MPPAQKPYRGTKLLKEIGAPVATFSLLFFALGSLAQESGSFRALFAEDALDPPARLPDQIRRAGKAAVRIETGSAVKIGPGLALTAGHTLIDAPIEKGITNCGRIDLQGRYDKVYNDPNRVRWAAIFQKKPEDSDIGLIDAGSDPALEKLAAVAIAPNAPSKGDVVYFINYQSDNDATNRFPNHFLLRAHASFPDGKKETNIKGPAMYAGQVLDVNEKDIQVATGIKGYGPKKSRQTSTHDGASGGPVFNETGELIGITVYSSEEKSVNSRDFKWWYGVNTKGRSIQLSGVEPVNQKVISSLQKQLKKRAAGCASFTG